MRYTFILLFLFLIGCSESDPNLQQSAPDGAFGTPGLPDATDNSDISGGDLDGTSFGGKDGGTANNDILEDVETADVEIDSIGTTDVIQVNDVVPDQVAEDIGPPPLDVQFEEPDTGCTAQCDGKECGSDGCGSICGFCQYGNACNDEGACIPICDPVTPCQGKVCGPDGCGGTCGDCDPSFACGEDGLCYESTCEPQCEDKECGPDLCGGVCGTCKGVKLCDTDAGECVANPCGNVGFKGACVDKYTVVQCLEGSLEFTDCTVQDEAWGCIWDAFDGIYE